MLAKKNGFLKDGKKIIMYSAHDLNLGAQILALGITKPHLPNFTSAVILELYQDNGNYFVQVRYIIFYTYMQKSKY